MTMLNQQISQIIAAELTVQPQQNPRRHSIIR